MKYKTKKRAWIIDNSINNFFSIKRKSDNLSLLVLFDVFEPFLCCCARLKASFCHYDDDMISLLNSSRVIRTIVDILSRFVQMWHLISRQFVSLNIDNFILLPCHSSFSLFHNVLGDRRWNFFWKCVSIDNSRQMRHPNVANLSWRMAEGCNIVK